MKHLKRVATGIAILAIVSLAFYLVSLVTSMINPDYILMAVAAVWLTFVCYITGFGYETYKEMKAIKPY